MELRTISIIIATLIPIVVVVYMFIDDRYKFAHLEKCNDESCVRLCCIRNASCEHLVGTLHNFSIAGNLSTSFKTIRGNPCKNYFEVDGPVEFKENGMLLEDEITWDWNHYCVDFNHTEPDIHICIPYEFVDRIEDTFPYFMICSIPFLIMTIIVYCSIRDLRNLHGKCLISYVSCLTIMYTALVIVYLNDAQLKKHYKAACTLLGYTILASNFCCFFWLNVMCFDIWVTFKSGMKTDNIKTYLKYCAYAFGIPITLVVIIFILSFFNLVPDEYNTNIGEASCQVSVLPDTDHDAFTLQSIYIYYPIVFFLTINILFYGITAFKIYRVFKETEICQRRKHSTTEVERIRFFLYVRLSIVMGIPWIIEVASFFFVHSPILFVASIFNCMQGFIIFITFVWKSKVTKLLARKYSNFSVNYRKTHSSVKINSFDTEATKMNQTNSLSLTPQH